MARLGTGPARRLAVKNGGDKPLWILWQISNEQFSEYKGGPPEYEQLNLPPAILLAPGADPIVFPIPDKGLTGFRTWAAYNCRTNPANGKGPAEGWFDCDIGGSGGLAQHGAAQPGCAEPSCAPPVDSKFEGTFGCLLSDPSQCQINTAAKDDKGQLLYQRLDNQDFVDTSHVDGWTLPYTVNISGKCAVAPPNMTIQCNTLAINRCTTEDLSSVDPGLKQTSLALLNPTTKAAAGCYSPCSKLNTDNWNNKNWLTTDPQKYTPLVNDYCCPAGWPKERCQSAIGQTSYAAPEGYLHASCQPAYTWAYDDANALLQCDAGSTYEVTFYAPILAPVIGTPEDPKEVVRKARRACRRVAANRDWTEIAMYVHSRVNPAQIVVNVQGKRNDAARERLCTYQVRNGVARFDDQG